MTYLGSLNLLYSLQEDAVKQSLCESLQNKLLAVQSPLRVCVSNYKSFWPCFVQFLIYVLEFEPVFKMPKNQNELRLRATMHSNLLFVWRSLPYRSCCSLPCSFA